MMEVFNRTYSGSWSQDIKNYESSKKNLAWGFNETPTIVTDLKIKQKDALFNPILQVYNDKNKEMKLKVTEKSDFNNTLAFNKDRALRYEQTFDILNLSDKLKGFENDPLYPKTKMSKATTNKGESRQNYNIISAITLDKHHYKKPEDRPVIDKVDYFNYF